MDIDRGLINLIVLILFLGGAIVGPIVKALQRRRAMQRGESPPPEVEQETEEEPAFEPWVEPKPEPEPEPVVRRVFRREPPAPVEPPPAAPVVAKVAPAPAPPAARPPSLDERLFRNPRLTPGARLVLASEILQRPRSLRRVKI